MIVNDDNVYYYKINVTNTIGNVVGSISRLVSFPCVPSLAGGSAGGSDPLAHSCSRVTWRSGRGN